MTRSSTPASNSQRRKRSRSRAPKSQSRDAAERSPAKQPAPDLALSGALWRAGLTAVIGLGVAGLVTPVLFVFMFAGAAGSPSTLAYHVCIAIVLLPFLVRASIVALLGLLAYSIARRNDFVRSKSVRWRALGKAGSLVMSSHGFYVASLQYLPQMFWSRMEVHDEVALPLVHLVAATALTLFANYAAAASATTQRVPLVHARTGFRQLKDAAGLLMIALAVPASTLILISDAELRVGLKVFALLGASLFAALATLQLVQSARTFAGQQNKLFAWPNLVLTMVIAGAVAAAVLHGSAETSASLSPGTKPFVAIADHAGIHLVARSHDSRTT